MIDLSGKIALVTGAGRGIGKGCAVELARHGAEVVINDRPGSPDLEATADEIRELGGKCQAMESDVFSRSGCEQLVTEAAWHFEGRIDILISNPAYSRRGAFLDYSPEEFERTIARNFDQRVSYEPVGCAGRWSSAAQGGKILFISSVLGEMPIGLVLGVFGRQSRTESNDPSDCSRTFTTPHQRQRDRTRMDRYAR